MAKIDLGECTSQQKQLQIDIKTKAFKPFYFVWGAEPYLRLQHKANLVKALMEGSDPINLLSICGDKIDLQDVVNFAETMPFFGERRVAVIDGGDFFKKSYKAWKDYFDAPIPGAVIVFTAEAADMTSSLFSFIKSCGRVVRCETPNTADLKRWVAFQLGNRNGKVFKESVINYFLERMGQNMSHIHNEIEKLVAYTAEREEITKKDIDSVCSGVEEAFIYKLSDAIADHNRAEAMKQYESMLLLEVRSGILLAEITRQLRNILVTSEMVRRHADTDSVAQAIGIGTNPSRNFVVGKLTRLASRFQAARLEEMVRFALQSDADVKSGRLDEVIALEMVIAHCTA